MQKIISLFKRDYDGTRLVYDEIVEGAEWVIVGEGMATQKYDGTACMVCDGKLFKRYTLKRGKTAPEGFQPATTLDEKTGKQEGWVPVGDDAEDRWHREAFEAINQIAENGTYELLGPKVQGNPEDCATHCLVAHELAARWPTCPRIFDELKEWFRGNDIEGIVWHHPDGRMVKIKKKDFGLKRED